MGDDVVAAELVWENEGGRLASAVSSPPPPVRPASVRIGRIYDAPSPHDGIRVLVDRLWPRGMTRARADIDQWCRQVAPSTPLRRWYRHDPERFTEFRRRYRLELAAGEQATALQHVAELAEGRTVTLLTATKDPATSEAVILAELLEQWPPELLTGAAITVPSDRPI